MVGVIAAVSGKIEGDRKALLAGRQVAPVEGVGILCGREAGILPDRPRLGDIHGGVGTAQERRQARIGLEEIKAGEIVRTVGRFHRDALGGLPGLAARGRCCNNCARDIDGGEIRDARHRLDPSRALHDVLCIVSFHEYIAYLPGAIAPRLRPQRLSFASTAPLFHGTEDASLTTHASSPSVRPLLQPPPDPRKTSAAANWAVLLPFIEGEARISHWAQRRKPT